MPLVKVKEKFQITLPAELREALHLAVGDLLEATIQDNVIVLTPKVVVDRAQAWAKMEHAMARVEDRAPNPHQSPLTTLPKDRVMGRMQNSGERR